MNIFKSFWWSKNPTSTSSYLTIEVMFEEFLKNEGIGLFIEKAVELLANKFAEEHGAEILKRIQDQTTDSKVIQKVISNLRDELEKK